MRSLVRRSVPVLGSVLLSTLAVAAAGARPDDGPERFVVPSLDGTPVVVVNDVDQRAVSAWAYRSGGEFDVAISIRDAQGAWSQPVFLGRSDRADQTDPTLAVDALGHTYLAYASSESGRVMLTVLARGSATWSSPVPVTPVGVRAASPALAVVGGRLVVAFRAGTRVLIVELPIADANGTLGIQDGPDPVGGKGSGNAGGGDSGTTPLGGE